MALVLLEESHGDADTTETSWHVPTSRMFLTLTCKVPANKQVQTQGIPLAQLWLLALVIQFVSIFLQVYVQIFLIT